MHASHHLNPTRNAADMTLPPDTFLKRIVVGSSYLVVSSSIVLFPLSSSSYDNILILRFIPLPLDVITVHNNNNDNNNNNFGRVL